MPYPEGRNPKDFEQAVPSKLRTFVSSFGPQALPQVYTPAFDKSKWQPQIDYAKAYAGGYRIVVMKATDGMEVDPTFTNDWQRALDAGFIVLTYHFFRSNQDGKTQADLHAKTVDPLRKAVKYILAAALDIETADGVSAISVRQTRAKAWWGRITELSMLPGVYSNVNYWQSLMGNMLLPLNVWEWVAAWTSATTPKLPTGWNETNLKLWQYGVYNNYPWCPPVPGVTGDIDVDRFLGTISDAKAWLGFEETPVPPVDHTHEEFAEINKKIDSLSAQMAAVYTRLGTQDARISQIEAKVNGISASEGKVPTAAYKVSGTQALARWDKKYNDAGFPIWTIYEEPERIKVTGNVNVSPTPFKGDGGALCYALVSPTSWYAGVPSNVTLYLRKEDIEPA
jgi:GH25 family lysozyme M1 (1,4-beta-N-acetylmuramidase)